jgi:hypothetical protein
MALSLRSSNQLKRKQIALKDFVGREQAKLWLSPPRLVIEVTQDFAPALRLLEEGVLVPHRPGISGTAAGVHGSFD